MTFRDLHGRGLRRPLFPPTVPAYRTRKDAFDELLAAAVNRLEPYWGNSWGAVEFGVEEVPPSQPSPWEPGVPLARYFPAELGFPARIIFYRRAFLQRVTTPELAPLLRDVLAEQLAQLTGLNPADIDPLYGFS